MGEIVYAGESCENFPQCGHRGYPDCVDLQRILVSNPRLAPRGIRFADFRKAAHWLMENRLRCSNQKWRWRDSRVLAMMVDVSDTAFVAAAMVLGWKRRKTGSGVEFFTPPW